MLIRKANISDIINIYQLANDPVVRENSFSKEYIPYEKHFQWFNNTINNKKCLLLVAEEEGNLVGQVRFDIENSDALISISISANFRGRKYSKKLLQMAMEELRVEYPASKRIRAYVKGSNRISKLFFESSNFISANKFLIKDTESIEYIYNL